MERHGGSTLRAGDVARYPIREIRKHPDAEDALSTTRRRRTAPTGRDARYRLQVTPSW